MKHPIDAEEADFIEGFYYQWKLVVKALDEVCFFSINWMFHFAPPL